MCKYASSKITSNVMQCKCENTGDICVSVHVVHIFSVSIVGFLLISCLVGLTFLLKLKC